MGINTAPGSRPYRRDSDSVKSVDWLEAEMEAFVSSKLANTEVLKRVRVMPRKDQAIDRTTKTSVTQ